MDNQPIASTAAKTPALPVERRREARDRVHIPLFAILIRIAEQPQIRIDTVDLSTHGIGFICRRLFQTDELFVVQFNFANDRGKLVLCRTTLCQAAGSKGHKIGASFLDAVTPTGSRKVPVRWVEMALGREEVPEKPGA